MQIDPVFDTLLHLFSSSEKGRKASLSDCALVSDVPPTTGLRYLTAMEAEGMIKRVDDPDDGRRVLVELSDRAYNVMQEWLAEVSSIPLRR